jgi:hypothetical protein
MLNCLVRFCMVTLILLMPVSSFPAWGQTASQTTPQSTTNSTTKSTPAPKPAPKPAPVIPAAKPAAKPVPSTTPIAAKPALPVTRATARPMPAAQTLPTRGAVGGGIVAGGKGAAIGAAPTTSKVSAVSTTTVAPAVRGRPAIPTTTPTAASVPTTNGRAAIPTAASTKAASTSSTGYLPSSSSGRSSIPTYGSSNANAAAASSGPATPGPNGSLGTFTYGQGMLTVYGCTRQGSQVLCDTDFNNQNQRATQVNTAWWGDVYLVDQNGDRHQRASAYFVNGAGEPREVLDIPYGQSARYIMVFNDFNQNVASVGFHSVYGNIAIENMSLDGSGGTVAGGDQQAQAASQGSSAVGNSVNGVTDSLKNNGKQRAGDARDKAVNKANDSMQKLMDRIPH